MKVLQIVNTYAAGNTPSAEPFVKAQIDSLINAGIDADVLNIKGNESKFNYLKAIHKCQRCVKEGGYDIVHGHYVYSGFIAALQTKAISVVSFMGSDLLGRLKPGGALSLHGRIDIILSRLLQRHVDGIIVKAKSMLTKVLATEKAIVLPNGVDFNAFCPMEKKLCRNELGLDPNACLILHVGSKTSPNKGYEIASQAVDLLQQKGDYRLVNVHNVPHERMPVYMNAADVLVLPSRYEGSPNVVKEACACNLPVVATDVGDVREVIGDIPGCFIVERDAGSFKRGIENSITHADTFAGRDAIKHLSADRIAGQLLDFYRNIITGKAN